MGLASKVGTTVYIIYYGVQWLESGGQRDPWEGGAQLDYSYLVRWLCGVVPPYGNELHVKYATKTYNCKLPFALREITCWLFYVTT